MPQKIEYLGGYTKSYALTVFNGAAVSDFYETSVGQWSSIKTGDVLLALGQWDRAQTYAGWTLSSDATSAGISWAWRRWDGTGFKTPAPTQTQDGAHVQVTAVRGVSATSPVAGVVRAVTTSTSTPLTLTPAAPAASSSVVFVLATEHNTGGVSYSNPLFFDSGYAEHYDIGHYRSNGSKQNYYYWQQTGSASAPAGGTAMSVASAQVPMTAVAFTLSPGDSPPNAAVLTTMNDNGTVARGDVNRTAYLHSDPDGDGQASRERRRRMVGASSWDPVVTETTVNQFFDYPASSLALGNHEQQVRTASLSPFGLLVWGPWSASGFFKVADRAPGPTFVSPINGQTVGSSTVSVEVSAANFDLIELQVLDAAGAVIVPIQSSATGLFTVTGLANSQTVTMRARVVLDTLAGEWTTISAPVSYTLPPTPTALLSPRIVDGWLSGITVAISVPTPTGGQPSVQSVAVLRSELLGGAWTAFRPLRGATALSPTATFYDLTVSSGVDNRYQIRADAVNGTSSLSDPLSSFTEGGAPVTNDPVTPTVEETV